MGAMIGPGAAGLLYTGESVLLILGLVAAAMPIAAGLMWRAHSYKSLLDPLAQTTIPAA